MFYNPTPRQHLSAVSTSIMSIVSTLSDAGQTKQPIAGVIPCFEANQRKGVNTMQGTVKARNFN